MKKIYILLFVLVAINSAKAQPCLPEGITFYYQEQIDNFQINYPGCTEIEGDVIINGNDIVNLNKLNVLTSIGGDLRIYFNTALTNLAGLVGLTSIGGILWIKDNYALTNLTGLDSLTFIGGELRIFYNSALTSLSGIDNIMANSIKAIYIYDNYNLSECDVQSICNYLISPSGSVNIYDNASGCNNPAEIALSCGYNLPCLPYGNYYFTSQEEIDNFQTNYPGCTELEGNVSIGFYELTDITNLDGLSDIESIEGYLSIYYTALTSLSGLDNLTSIDSGLYIYDNDALINLSGLDNLTFIGEFLYIYGNDALTSLSGLENLTYIGEFYLSTNIALVSLSGLENVTSIGGNLIIDNSSLSNLSGLENATSIGGYLKIYDDHALTNLTGLGNVTSIGGELTIAFNTLTNLTGLDNLTSIGGVLDIYNNDSLLSLTGLEGLTSIGGHLYIAQNALTNLTGLGNVTSIGGALQINDNYALTSLTGLDNIESGSIFNLWIYHNSTLSTCDVQSICNYLANPNGLMYIYENATGCNSTGEVQQACLTTVEEIKTEQGFTIIPNPSNDKITISSPLINGNTQLSIFNVRGEKIIERQLTNSETQLDISALPRGVYFMRVQDEKRVEVAKMIKQ